MTVQERTEAFLSDTSIIGRLGLISRAYQVHYALGGKSSDNLTQAEQDMFIRIAGEVRDGCVSTAMHRKLADAMCPAMLRYVTTGKLTFGGAA
jgi:hypothetical protein